MSSKLAPLDRPVDRAAHHFERAVRLLKDGNNSTLELERAVKEINRARALQENMGSHNIALAEAYTRALDTSSAIFALRFSLEKNPNDVAAKKGLCDLLLNRAQETMIQGKHFEKASNYFEDALAMDPSRDRIWILKAVCEVRCKRFKIALQCVDRAINMSSNPPVDMYVLRAKIQWALGLRDAGNTEMRKAAVMDSTHPEVRAFIARAFGEAEKTYEEGLIAFQGGDLDKAITLVNKALFVNRNDVKLHILLSKCWRAKNDLDTAYKSLTEAVDIFKAVDPYGMYTNVKIPHEINRQKNLIINEMALKFAVEGDFQKAILLMNKAIASERKMHDNDLNINYMFFLNRGDCYRAIDEPLFAIADYKMALERRPGMYIYM
jgi:tetratricopeptide (TPR) repeat protein